MSEIIWSLSFPDWLISLSIMLSRSIHGVANGKISSSFIAEWYSIVCIDHIVFIHSSLDGHLGAFHLWLLWILLRWTRVHKYLFWDPVFNSFGYILKMELLDHMLRHLTPQYFNMRDSRMRLFCCVSFFFYWLKVQIIVAISWHTEYAF